MANKCCMQNVHVCVRVYTLFQEIWTESSFICAARVSFYMEIVGLCCVILPDQMRNTLRENSVCVCSVKT